MSVEGAMSVAVMVGASGDGITVAVEIMVVARGVERTDDESMAEAVEVDGTMMTAAADVVVGAAVVVELVCADVVCWVDGVTVDAGADVLVVGAG